MIIRGGINIYPEEIEAVLMAHPAVAEAAVIGVPDAARGEEVAAYIVLRGEEVVAFVVLCSEADGVPDINKANKTDDARRTWCRERLAPYKQPRDLVRIDVLPRNSSGKVRKALLKQIALKG